MDAEFVSRDTDTPRGPNRTHSSAGKLPTVLEAEKAKDATTYHSEGRGLLAPTSIRAFCLCILDVALLCIMWCYLPYSSILIGQVTLGCPYKGIAASVECTHVWHGQGSEVR
jgi:hypothetical protein